MLSRKLIGSIVLVGVLLLSTSPGWARRVREDRVDLEGTAHRLKKTFKISYQQALWIAKDLYEIAEGDENIFSNYVNKIIDIIGQFPIGPQRIIIIYRRHILDTFIATMKIVKEKDKIDFLFTLMELLQPNANWVIDSLERIQRITDFLKNINKGFQLVLNTVIEIVEEDVNPITFFVNLEELIKLEKPTTFEQLRELLRRALYPNK